MSIAAKTTCEECFYEGEKCFITQEGLLFNNSRLVHLSLHGFQLKSREGVSTHGIWGKDN